MAVAVDGVHLRWLLISSNRLLSLVRRSKLQSKHHGPQAVVQPLLPHPMHTTRGLSWIAADKSWQVSIAQKYIGRFKTKEAALAACEKAAREKYGKFYIKGEVVTP